MKLAYANMVHKEQILKQETNTKGDKDHKIDNHGIQNNGIASRVSEDILDKINMVFYKWLGYTPDPSRTTVEVLKAIEIQVLKDIRLNDEYWKVKL